MAVAVEVMDLVAERREQLFPDLRKIVVDYSCSVDGGTHSGSRLNTWLDQSAARPTAVSTRRQPLYCAEQAAELQVLDLNQEMQE